MTQSLEMERFSTNISIMGHDAACQNMKVIIVPLLRLKQTATAAQEIRFHFLGIAALSLHTVLVNLQKIPEVNQPKDNANTSCHNNYNPDED